MEENEEKFEVVRRKSTKNTVETTTGTCMILSEEELKSQENRLNCRRGVGDMIGDLFRVQRDRKDFPKIFQNYKPSSDIQKATPFAFMRQKTTKKVELEMPDFSKLNIKTPPLDDYDPPYAEKTP